MVKVTGAYESVVRGVSQQVPQDRRSGQHEAQDNFISDPVRGLARRHGSRLIQEVSIGATADFDAMVADTRYSQVTRFLVDGGGYDIIYRTRASGLGVQTFAWCFNRDTGGFIPIVYGSGTAIQSLISGGVSASTNIGRYVYLAGNTIIPEYTETNVFQAVTNTSKAAVWLRGGAYSRTFKVTVTKLTGTKVVASYKTVSSSYPTLLNTSDILSTDTEYQKKVNDRVYAYNSEVTKWIGTAAADVTPENIAQKLADALIAAGIVGVARIGGTVTIDDPSIRDIAGEDGGDGSLLRAVGSEVTSAELVSTIHYAGKIVKVRPQKSNGDDAFYLQAYPKDAGATGFTDVSWRESAGIVQQPTVVFALGTVVAGTLYLAGTPAELTTISGIATPAFQPNSVGDPLTAPLPYMFGKRITYLGVMQDRLVVGSGATVLMSRPGEYFNWFRQSVLTLIDNDPWEGYAQGAEDDTLRYSQTYDKDLFLFGDRFQYAVSGRQQISPKTSNVTIVSRYEDTTDAAPRASGNLIFYAKYAGEAAEEKTSLHQVQAGAVAESPESFEISQALDGYLEGKPVQIVAMSKPNMVVVRTDGARNVLYTYGYLDNANGTERVLDNWSRWTWDIKVGSLVGLTAMSGSVVCYMLRYNAGVAYIACERFVRDTGLSAYPYADSLRPLSAALTAPFMSGTNTGAIVALARTATDYAFMGVPYARLAEFQTAYAAQLAHAWVGFLSDAYVTPTNPYTQDRNGRSILTGRLTLGRVLPAVADTGGLTVEVNTSSGMATPLSFNGRLMGVSSNRVGRQPIVTTSLGAVVGREIRECSYTLRARTWLPLTITAIEWSGQYFNNAKRV